MNTLGIVDSHIHLQDYETGTDIGALLAQAKSAGVSHLVCNATSEASWARVLGYSRRHPEVIPCFGVHPWFLEESSKDWLANLERFLRESPSGVGEIGLDRLREYSSRDTQESAFRAQLDLAARLDRPAMIHCVRAWGWMTDVLRSEPRLPGGMLFHSYTGSEDLVKPLADMGAYFSFAGKVLEENYARARKSIRAVPSDRLLIETDGPCMLPPERFRVQTIVTVEGELHNLPVNLPPILLGIAELLGENPESLRERLWHNSQEFFGRIAPLESCT